MNTFARRAGVAVCLAGVLISGWVLAAEAAGPYKYNSFKDVLDAGGLTMKFILALSMLAVFLVIYYLFTLRASVVYPDAFIREAENAAADGDIEGLKKLCLENDSPAAQVVAAAVEQVEGAERADYLIVRDAIEGEGARQASVLWQRIQYLLDVAVIAPMVGLLGTVLGMLQSFAGMEVEMGVVKPLAVAAGVAKALITTVGGLIVGITAMSLYALFRGRVNSLVGGLESASSRVFRRLMAKAPKRN
ncbi:MAG: hypothetical protein A3K19_26285 [Lentisphaerae bacterium RIFOXYB12_FULL_65_16]|nr:MAG: hypothetical protein A3K18_08455 [Lentisphaerae bacterium RIFOXYA12_64_32]OGV87784.1 MAG: hypothetical protein A3K19_26285 [Lentisphaerae bacterium RIFOXYB12_FULL_65_16]